MWRAHPDQLTRFGFPGPQDATEHVVNGDIGARHQQHPQAPVEQLVHRVTEHGRLAGSRRPPDCPDTGRGAGVQCPGVVTSQATRLRDRRRQGIESSLRETVGKAGFVDRLQRLEQALGEHSPRCLDGPERQADRWRVRADLDLQLRPGIDGGEHAVGRLAVLDGVACQRQLGEFVDPDRVAVG